jgi:dihydroorotase
MTTVRLPGLIDCHVHFREPGLTHKGDMQSESRAALAGGVTTVCDMPNTVPPTVTVEALQGKVRRAERIRDCDIRFFFGVTEAKNLIALRKIWIGSETHLRLLCARCVGVKLYLDHSTGNMGADRRVTEETFKLCGELGIPVVCHCEDPGINRAHPERPPESEEHAVSYAIGLARTYRAPLHIAHISTKGAVDLVRRAKAEGLSVTCEAAPHHLFLTLEDLSRLGPLGKVNPPLRSSEHQEALWDGIADRTVDCIATDHAPHTLEEKNSDRPPSGVPGVETMLPLLLTVSSGLWPGPNLQHSTFDIQHSDIIRLCFTNPNRIFALGKRAPEQGGDAIEIDLEKEWTIRGADLHSKCGWTPFEGWRVKGKVVR